MTAFQVKCPGCGTLLQLPVMPPGSGIKCPKCAQVFRLATPGPVSPPSPQADAAATPAPPAPARPAPAPAAAPVQGPPPGPKPPVKVRAEVIDTRPSRKPPQRAEEEVVEKPAPRRRAAEEEEAPARRAKPKKSGAGKVLLAAAAVLFLLCGGALGGGYWAVTRLLRKAGDSLKQAQDNLRPPTDTGGEQKQVVATPVVEKPAEKPKENGLDVRFVPADSTAGLVFQPERLLRSPLVSSVVPADVLVPLGAETGVDPRKVERVLLLTEPLEPGALLFFPGWVVQFHEPVDGRAILTKELKGLAESSFEGKTYFNSKTPDTVLLSGHIADERTLVLAPEPTLQKMLVAKGDGPLARRLRRLDLSSDLPAAFVLEPARADLGRMLKEGKGSLPAELGDISDLHERVKGGALALNLSGDTLLKVTLDADSGDSAVRLEGLLGKGKDLLQQAYPDLKKRLVAGVSPEAARDLVAVLDQLPGGITVRRSGQAVTAELKMPTGLAELGPKVAPSVRGPKKAPGGGAGDAEAEEKAARDLAGIGAELERDEAAARPVVLVRIADRKVAVADLKPLADLKGLKKLILVRNELDDRAAPEVGRLKTLETLVFGDNDLTDATLKELGGLTRLRLLNVGGTKISDAGVRHLGALSELRELHLNSTGVTLAEVEELARLKKLRTLDINDTRVTAAGCKAIAAIPNLEELDLFRTPVGDAGLKELAALKGLRSLNLPSTMVTNAGLKHLAGLNKLEYLNLADTEVTDAGLKEFPSLKALKILNLRGTKVTPSAVAALQKALPGCKIEVNFRGLALPAPLGDGPEPALLGILKGHGRGVTCLAFTPDSKMVASGGEGGTLKLWDVASKKALTTIDNAHANEVNSVAFSPNGKIVASCGLDSAIKLSDVPSGKGRAIKVPLKERHYVSAVRFSPDGKTIAEADSNQTAPRIWDVSTGKVVVAFPADERGDCPRCLAFTPDGKRLAVGYNSQDIKVWDVASHKETATFKTPSSVASVAISPDGKALAAAASEDTIRLWDLATGKETGALAGPKDQVLRCVAFSADGKLIAACGIPRSEVLLWDVASGKLVAALKGHEAYCRAVAFSPDGKVLASGSQDGTIRLWDLQGGRTEPGSSSPGTGPAPPAGVIASSGFNDARGLNSDPAPNSPYPLGKSNVRGGSGEPGWEDLWPASPKATFVKDVVGEGDGALHLTATVNYGRSWTSPQGDAFAVEVMVRSPRGGGVKCYVWDDGAGSAGPYWRVADGKFLALDGDGLGGGKWSPVAECKPDTWHRVRLSIDTKKQRWGMAVDDAPGVKELGFRYRPAVLRGINFLAEEKEEIYLDAIRILGASTAATPPKEPAKTEPAKTEPAAGKADEAKAARELARLGVKVTTDDKQPGQPVVAVDFSTATFQATNTLMPKVGAFRSLHTLILPAAHVNGEGLKHLRGLEGLRTLDLTRTKLKDKDMAEVKLLRGVQRLSLRDSLLTDAGVKELAEMPALEHLDLSYTQVTDAGLKELKALKGLKTLRLTQTRVTDAGVKELKALKGLTFLDLFATRITDAALADLKELGGLESLGLGLTRISDKGLKELVGMKSLMALNLEQTRVTKEAVEALARTLPEGGKILYTGPGSTTISPPQ